MCLVTRTCRGEGTVWNSWKAAAAAARTRGCSCGGEDEEEHGEGGYNSDGGAAATEKGMHLIGKAFNSNSKPGQYQIEHKTGNLCARTAY
jgi:hypothetical protein